MNRKQPGLPSLPLSGLTFFIKEEGKFLYFLGVRDAHLTTHLLQYFCCHLGKWMGL